MKIIKAMANPKRMEIVLHLEKRRVLNVSEVSEKLDLSFKSTSKHLHKLEEAGLIGRKKRMNMVYYFLSADLSKEVRDVINLFARIGE
ncbi:MAG: metalloregulator ArsR/SmtB family transcription factor [Patescibacteria group bacterium]